MGIAMLIRLHARCARQVRKENEAFRALKHLRMLSSINTVSSGNDIFLCHIVLVLSFQWHKSHFLSDADLQAILQERDKKHTLLWK